MKQYFDILGLPTTASLTQIKKAYRKLVMKYHPDHNDAPEAMDKFIAIDEAYDTIVEFKKTGNQPRVQSITAQPSRSAIIRKEEMRLKKEYAKWLFGEKRKFARKRGTYQGIGVLSIALALFIVPIVHDYAFVIMMPAFVLYGVYAIWSDNILKKRFEAKRKAMKNKFQKRIFDNRKRG